MEFRTKGVLEQSKDVKNNKRAYTNLSTDIIEDFLFELSKPTKSYMNVLTGKRGAIEMHLNITRTALTYMGYTEEVIEKRLKEDRLKLEKELTEGMYQISTDPKKALIKKIDYADRW